MSDDFLKKNVCPKKEMMKKDDFRFFFFNKLELKNGHVTLFYSSFGHFCFNHIRCESKCRNLRFNFQSFQLNMITINFLLIFEKFDEFSTYKIAEKCSFFPDCTQCNFIYFHILL